MRNFRVYRIMEIRHDRYLWLAAEHSMSSAGEMPSPYESRDKLL